MSNLHVVLQNRDFTERLDRTDLKYTINSYDFTALGGCGEASISVLGGEPGLWDVLNWLRCPVVITNKMGRAVWWGYVFEAAVRVDAIESIASLATMYNRVAVAYTSVPDGASAGRRETTSWADDLDSQADFGIKELLSSDDGNTPAGAEARRAAVLAAQGWPYWGASTSPSAGGASTGSARTRIRYSGAKRSMSATLICHGWWDTLGWKYAKIAAYAGNLVEHTAQISSLVTSYGQFMTATDVEAVTGVSSSDYQDGDKTTLAAILKLMASGGASGRRLLASVDPNRRVQIYEEPAASTADYFMDSHAQIASMGGNEIDPYAPPVGMWVRLKDVMSPVVDVTRLVDPTLQFVEGSSWSADGGPKYSFRGQPGVESLLAVGG